MTRNSAPPALDGVVPSARRGKPPSPETCTLTRELLAAYARDREETFRERLVQMHAPVVRYLARRFAQRREPIEDLERAGFGLIQAIECFDPSLGNEFACFAVPTIVCELRRDLRNNA